MKSRVKQAMDRQFYEQNMRPISIDDNGAIYTFSSEILEVIRRQAPNIKFVNWYCSKDGVWLVTATQGERSEIVRGSNITDCIVKAKDLFLQNSNKGE